MSQEQDIQLLLNEFYNNPENVDMIDKYRSETFFDIIGKAHSETVHNNFLEWYFGQSAWNSMAIMQMIRLAMKKSNKSEISYKGLYLDLNKLNDYAISGIEVKRERKCTVNTNGRKRTGKVDIVISCKLKDDKNEVPVKIIIENKIDSLDHDHQTYVYYTFFSNNESTCSRHGKVFKPYVRKHKYDSKKNEIQLFFFLSPSYNPGDSELSCICNSFIRISYQDLYDSVVKSFSMQSPTDANKRGELFLEEYRKILIKPYIKSNKIRIMAYDNNDLERLETFWRNNRSLFKLALEVFCKETEDAEEKERISSVIQATDSLDKKYIRYNLIFPGGECLKNERMKVVAKKTVEYLLGNNVKVSDINALLPKGITPLMDIEVHEAKRRESMDSKFEKRWDKLDKENYYLSNQWTTTLFAHFMSNLSKAYPEIRIENATSTPDDLSDI